jgi:hypothetical protein
MDMAAMAMARVWVDGVEVGGSSFGGNIKNGGRTDRRQQGHKTAGASPQIEQRNQFNLPSGTSSAKDGGKRIRLK